MAISVQQRPLPAVPVPCTSIGIPTPVEDVCPNNQQRPLPAVPVPCTSIGIPTSVEDVCPNNQDENDGYTRFVPPAPSSVVQRRLVYQDTRSRSSTLDTTSSSDDDIYSEPYCAVPLKSTSKGAFSVTYCDGVSEASYRDSDL